MNWFELNLPSHVLKVLMRDFRRKNPIEMDEQACTCWQSEMQISFYWTWMSCQNFVKVHLRDTQGPFTFSWEFSMERAGWKNSIYFRRDWSISVFKEWESLPKFLSSCSLSEKYLICNVLLTIGRSPFWLQNYWLLMNKIIAHLVLQFIESFSVSRFFNRNLFDF